MFLLIADTSPIISLLLFDQFETLEMLFPDISIPQAVWEELNNHNEIRIYSVYLLIKQHIRNVRTSLYSHFL